MVKTNWFDLFKYPRSLLVSWLGNAGAQTGAYGIALWAPSLFVLLLSVTPQQASKMMILLTVAGFIGRVSLLLAVGTHRAAQLRRPAGLRRRRPDHPGRLQLRRARCSALSAFWLILAAAMFFVDGGFAIVGPYAAEIWPSHLKTTGMGSAYGFGGIGKILGPVGLALIVGSRQLPQARRAAAADSDGFPLSRLLVPDGRGGLLFLRLETKGKSIEQIDRELAGTAD